MRCAGQSSTPSAPRATQPRPLPRHGRIERHRQRAAAQRPGGHEAAIHASRRLCYVHLSPLFVFVSPLQSTARPTASTTAITAEVAEMLSVGGGSILVDSVLFSRLPRLVPVAARRLGAARRRQRRLLQRSSAAARTGRLGRTACASAAALATPDGSPTAATHRLSALRKWRVAGRFFCRCVYVCACTLCVSDALNSPLHEGMRSVAGA